MAPRFTLETVLHLVPAIVIGVTIDKIFRKVQRTYNWSPLVLVVVQLLAVILVLYSIEKYVSRRYAKEWQDTTPGLFFSFFIFLVQFNFTENLHKVVDMYD